ncbi:ribosome recycling factor, partial [Hungatella sp. SL.1.14]|nr:ribosome recycling factor [Hungatella sp. SL.1.14]
DDLAEAEEDIQKLTDKMIGKIDKAIEAKSMELLTV